MSVPFGSQQVCHLQVGSHTRFPQCASEPGALQRLTHTVMLCLSSCSSALTPGAVAAGPHSSCPRPVQSGCSCPQTQTRPGAMQTGTGAHPSSSKWTNRHLLMYTTYMLSFALVLHLFDAATLPLFAAARKRDFPISVCLTQGLQCQNVRQLPLSLIKPLYIV